MGLAQLIHPHSCPGCRTPAFGLCERCEEELAPWQEGQRCHCLACHEANCICPILPSVVSSVHALWRFEGVAVDIIERVKYQGELWRLEAVRGQIRSFFRSLGERRPQEVVVPVPTTGRRLRKRGFDLPSILAGWLATEIEGRVRRDMLCRVEEGQPQRSLDRSMRLAAVQDVFEARKCAPEVILLDDVITSGATVSVCASALGRLGVQRVRVVSLARTPLEIWDSAHDLDRTLIVGV